MGLLILLVGTAAAYVARAASQQWDFETFYYAASALRAGLNPYHPGSLSAIAGRPVDLPYLYPPVVLALFSPLSYLPLDVAKAIWLGSKCLLAGLLLRIWWKDFLRPIAPELLLAVALFGFDAALLWDLRSGNVALIEGTLLWLSFSAWLRGRPALAAVLIVLASVFKLVPIVYLGLLLVSPDRRPRLAAGAFGVFLILLALPGPLAADWARALIAALSGGIPGGSINPSALAVLGAVLPGLGPGSGGSHGPAVAAYLLYGIVIVAASRFAIHRIPRAPERIERVVLAVLLWLLLSPRPMVYSYLMAVVPCLLVIRWRIASPPWRAAAYACLAFAGVVRMLPGDPPAALGGASFFLVLGAWLLYLNGPRRGRGGSGA